MTPARICRSLLSTLFLGFLFLAVDATTEAQTTIHVPADQPSIQAAIVAAVNGDTVLVAPGTYDGLINFQGKNITVTSSGDASQTILDGQNDGSVVTFSSGEGNGAVLSGFTIQHGYNTNGGGGISITNGQPTIENNVIVNNGCGEGGGIDIVFSSPIVQYNTIYDNNVAAGCYPGGVGGGGIAIRGASKAQILYNEIYGNLGGYDGGGIEMWAAGNALIEGNYIHDNLSEETQGGGMEIDNEGSSVVIDNVIVHNQGGVYWGRMPGNFSNNTVAYNTLGSATVELGAFSWWDGVFLNNVIVPAPGGTAINCDNSTYYDITTSTFLYNDVYGNGGTAYTCTDQTGINNNISLDPPLCRSGQI